jgi:hypothetical protein
MREGRFNLELANVHAYALACKLAGDDHPAAPLEILVSCPPRDLVTVGRRWPRPLFSLPYQCPSISFHALCLSLSNRTHTHARVRDADATRGTAPPSRLRRPRLHPCLDCVAVLLALGVVAKPRTCLRDSREDMDTAIGRSMLTHAREGQGLAFLWPDLM